MTDQNQLITVVQQSGLDESKTENLLAKFGGYFQEAKEIKQEAKKINVTSIDDVEGMSQARELRLRLQRVRTRGVEETRKALKEQSLREGRAIDGISNVIKALIAPVEEHLMAQEKFAERIKAEADSKKEAERHAKLSKYVDEPDIYKLHPDDLNDDAFEKLLDNARIAYEAKKKAEEQAEQERLEHEKKEKVYRDRLMELAPIAKFQPRPIGIDTDEREYQEILRVSKATAEKYEMEQEQIRIQNAKLQEEKEKAEKARLEAEEKLRKQKELEEKKALEEKKRIEDQKRLEEEEARKKLLAPDKTKLMELANSLVLIEMPAVKSNEAQQVINNLQLQLEKLANEVRNEATKL